MRVSLKGILVAGVLAVLLPEAGIVAQSPVKVSYRLEARHSRKCLDISSSSRNDQAFAIQLACGKLSSQSFSLDPNARNGTTLVAKHSGKCLEVQRASRSQGAYVVQARCNQREHQLFKIDTSSKDGYARIVARHSGQCLTVRGASAVDRTNVVQQRCSGNPSQQWKLSPLRANIRLR